MPDLNSYDEVTQLSEDMQYPDGHNCVEIFGNGDKRQTRVWPTITITGPAELLADGVAIGAYTINVFDPNADNPFFIGPGTIENASVSSPYDIEVSQWITRVHNVWADTDKTIRIPDIYISTYENKIHISDEWRPNGFVESGLPYQVAVVEYDGQYTCAVSLGHQDNPRWWEPPIVPTTTPPDNVEGTLFHDVEAARICESGTVAIPNVTGQNVTFYVYFRPNGGSAGVAYINAAYGEVSATTTTVVIAGAGQSNINLSIDADPSSISPYEITTLTVTGTFDSGAPITSGTGEFYIYKGHGQLAIDSAEFSSVPGESETVYTSLNSSTSLKTSFSLAHPIVSIQSIVAVGGGFTWNGLANISGSSVDLVDQEFPAEVIPIRVTYTWGGRALATYQTLPPDVVGDKVYLGFRFAGRNALCEVEISSSNSGGGQPSLSISAEDGTLGWGDTTNLVIVATNADGSGGVGTVSLTCVNNKGTTTPTQVSLGTKAVVEEIARINSLSSFTVDLPPVSAASFSMIRFGSPGSYSYYHAQTVDGTTVTITNEFPVSSGDITVSYQARGSGSAVFTAPNENTTCYIVARWGLAEPATESIKIDTDSTSSGGKLTLTAESSSVLVQETTQLYISAVCSDGTPGTGTVRLSNAGDPAAGSTPATVALGTSTMTGAKGSINGYNTFTVDLPTKLSGVSNITFLGKSYTPVSVTDGTIIRVTPAFPTVTGEVDLDYVCYGFAECTFTAPGVKSDCYVTASWKDPVENKDVDPQAVMIQATTDDDDLQSSSLTFSADPTDLDYGQTAILVCSCIDARGNGSNNVSFSIIGLKGGVFDRPSGDPALPGELEGAYTAPSQVGVVQITAHYTDAYTKVSRQVPVTIRVIHEDKPPPPPPKYNITATVEPAAIEINKKATITVAFTNNDEPEPSKMINAEITSGKGSVSSGITGSTGQCNLTFTASDVPGPVVVKLWATVGSTKYQTSVNINVAAPEMGPSVETAIVVTGKVKPSLQISEPLTSGTAILSWGVAADVDEYWCVIPNPNEDIVSRKIFLTTPIRNRVPYGHTVTNISCSAPGWTPPADWNKKPDGTINYDSIQAIDVYHPWANEKNSSVVVRIYVGDKADPSLPVVDATVKLGSLPEKRTDSDGWVEFSMPPIGQQSITITHPNYTRNIDDADPGNDAYVVAGYSTRPWRLNETTISYRITITSAEPKKAGTSV